MTPEEKAREKIDGLLQHCGWEVQDRSAINLSASRYVALCVREPEILAALAEWLVRLEKRIDSDERASLEKLAGGKSLSQLARPLLEALDPGKVEAAAQFLAASESGCGCSGDEPPEPTPAQLEDALESMVKAALVPIANNSALRQRLFEPQRAANQNTSTISTDTLVPGHDVPHDGAYASRSLRD